MKAVLRALVGVALLGWSPSAVEAQWPQWQGPQRNAVAEGELGDTVQLREVWRTPLDAGAGSVAVVGETAYVLASDLDNDLLIALATADGKERWRVALGATSENAPNGPGSTPAVVGDRIFALSSGCTLVAVDGSGKGKGKGEVLWRRDLVADFQAAHGSGCATSPWPHKSAGAAVLIVHVNGRERGRVVAFHQSDGSTAWEATAEPARESSPVPLQVGGTPQLAVQTWVQPGDRWQETFSRVYGLDLASRAIRWSFSTDESFSYTSPLAVAEGQLLLSTWSDSHLLEVRPGQSGQSGESGEPGQPGESGESSDTVQVRWSNRDIRAHIGLPIYHDGHVYGFANDDLSCIDVATGKTRWKERTYPASLLLVDGHLVLLSEHAGLLRVAQVDADGYREKARIQLVEPGYALSVSPSYAEGKIYVRTPEAVIAIAVTE